MHQRVGGRVQHFGVFIKELYDDLFYLLYCYSLRNTILAVGATGVRNTPYVAITNATINAGFRLAVTKQFVSVRKTEHRTREQQDKQTSKNYFHGNPLGMMTDYALPLFNGQSSKKA